MLLDILSVAMDVCFSCTYISCPSDPVAALPFQQLQILKLGGNATDIDVLTLISKTALNLKILTLSSCIFRPANSQHHQIEMPHTDLESLSIISGRTIWGKHSPGMEHGRRTDWNNIHHGIDFTYANQYVSIKKISAKIGIEQDQMVLVNMVYSSSNLVEHYALKPGNPAMIMAVSKDKYSAFTFRSPNMMIVCKSLGTLLLDVGALSIELKPGVGRPLEDTGDWKKAIEGAVS